MATGSGGLGALAGISGSSAAGKGGGGSGGIEGFAGGGAAGVSGGAGGTQYEPCPALPEPCRIMASGDSITVGAQSTDSGGYRVPLFRSALDAEKTITFVGPSGAGPATVDGVAFPDAHDGHSGYVIDTVGSRKGLTPLMAANLAKFRPNIVLLMIGTNDINSDVDVEHAPARLSSLIDLVVATAPNALLIVAQLIPTRTDALNVEVRKLNEATAALVKARADAGKHVVLVDMYGAFATNPEYKTEWLFDGLHPNDAGYAQMSKVWYSALVEVLH